MGTGSAEMLTPDGAPERLKLTKGPSSEDEVARLTIEVSSGDVRTRTVQFIVLYCVCASKLAHKLLSVGISSTVSVQICMFMVILQISARLLS